MRRRVPLPGLFLAGGLLLAQQPVGRLVYTNPAGRGVSLTVVDGGHPAFVTLKPEIGDAEGLRLFVLTHSGPEALVAKGAAPLAERAPDGWRAGNRGGGVLLRNGEATFWRYANGLVLPVRFTRAGQNWTLAGAELPARMLVAN